jgi:hypothetical protein
VKITIHFGHKWRYGLQRYRWAGNVAYQVRECRECGKIQWRNLGHRFVWITDRSYYLGDVEWLRP